MNCIRVMHRLTLVICFIYGINIIPSIYSLGFIKSKYRTEQLNDNNNNNNNNYNNKFLTLDQLPKQLDYRKYNNNTINYASIDRNEFQPYYCGACWAFAATSALSDRLKILRKNAFPEINLSPQVILNCDKVDLGCHGGDFGTAYEFIYQNGGIPDETCQIYEARGHDTGKSCNPIDKCRQCDDDNNICKARITYKKWQISSHGLVNGTLAMMNEIYRNGPIACAVAEVPDLMHYKGGIIHDKTGRTSLDHAISIVGWGESAEDGTKYWIVRNQWVRKLFYFSKLKIIIILSNRSLIHIRYVSHRVLGGVKMDMLVLFVELIILVSNLIVHGQYQ